MTYQESLQRQQEAVNTEIRRRAERMNNLLLGTEQEVAEKKALDYALCKQNIDHWLLNWAWVYEPRLEYGGPRAIPCILTKYQQELIKELQDAILNGHDLRIEKSRDLRVTWTVLMLFTYYWQFHGMTFLVGSRKAEEVDKLGDLDTLLPRVRFLLEAQPKWLLPKGFDPKEHTGWMNIQNPETKGSIAGESNNASFATGGRRNAIFFDEFAKWEFTDSAAWTSAGQTSPCRIAVSTPLFRNNRFFLLRKENIRNITLHWSQDPIKGMGLVETEGKKSSPWYEKQKLRYAPDELAQELDISYGGTASSTVLHEELAQMRIEKRIAPVQYLDRIPVYWAFDPAFGHTWANGFYQVIGYSETVQWFDYYENQNQDLEEYVNWVKAPERFWNKLRQDKKPGGENYVPGWQSMLVVPDPNIATNTEMGSGKSLVTRLKSYGFQNIIIKPVGKKQAINEAKRLMKKLWMDDGTFSERMILALERMQMVRYKYNQSMQVFEDELVEDSSKDCFDQFKYFANALLTPLEVERKIERLRNWEEEQLTVRAEPGDVGMAGI